LHVVDHFASASSRVCSLDKVHKSDVELIHGPGAARRDVRSVFVIA
jgi:hypothetical protein